MRTLDTSYCLRKEFEPLIEIDYEDFGGFERYQKIREIYWYYKFNDFSYFDVGVKYKLPEDTIKSYVFKFEEEVNKPIKIYA